jgi:hypothetical protein
MGKYWKKALKLLQKEYKQCPVCGTPTTVALLCEFCDHMHCIQCEAKMTRIPVKIAKKARIEQDKETIDRHMITSVSPDGKRVTVREITGDPYLEIVQGLWQDIVHAYQQHADKKPIVLYDLQDHRIYVYPYLDFRADLSERSQLSLTQQYLDALANGQFVVFVRDNENEKLVSYTLPPKDDTGSMDKSRQQ